LPAFVTVVLIPLTLSITQGILWGFLLYALLYAVAGRSREVSVTLWLLSPCRRDSFSWDTEGWLANHPRDASSSGIFGAGRSSATPKCDKRDGLM
jgi:hypothetical protein